MSISRFIIAAVALVGCGSDYAQSQGNSVEGSFQGEVFTVSSSYSGTVTAATSQWTKIWLSTQDSICEQSTIAAHAFQSSRWLTFDIFSTAPAGLNDATGAAPITGPGTYVVYDMTTSSAPQTRNVASVFYGAWDGGCVLTSSWRATSGTVNVAEASETGIQATFDVTFAGQDTHVTGTIDTSSCALLASSSDASAGMPMCQ